MDTLFLILAGLVTLLVFLWKWHYRKNKVYFESKGIPYRGNAFLRIALNSLKGLGVIDDILASYKQNKAENTMVTVTNDFGVITIRIQDPDLLKAVLVKDFDHFADRRNFTIPKNDYLYKKMIFSLKGEPWKALRTKLSPTFTTGKIKRLFSLFDQSGEKLVKYIEQEIGDGGEFDIIETYSKFAMDIIASSVCGIDSHAFDQKEPSFFEVMGRKMQLTFGGATLIKILIISVSSSIADFFGFSLFAKDVPDFFSVAIKASIHDRQTKNEKRNDFIQLMLEAREDKLKTEDHDAELLDDEGIVANAVLFIFGGYDTTSSLLIFTAYSLALHPNIQDKLRTEIGQVLEENGGELSYDALNKMTYLDMVISETLRYYPPLFATDRGCTKDYKIPGTEFVMKKGQVLLIPTYGLHHDADYFPEPEKFNPERFSPENKAKINHYAYLPFGAGPRNCIGMNNLDFDLPIILQINLATHIVLGNFVKSL
ncbi:cytochrome P450 9e2 [Folsomia candida]|uniref:cytochrome P450 9e2 n=1 Tax=Folsomia candida TaxID=158441 RepID=UPI0016055421|nr:cytochrome P450 9e2 [Folsomia candida]